MQTHLDGSALARLGHALSDPTRASLLLLLADAPGYPAELADRLGVSRQSLSNHLACLRGCGLVVVEPEGRRARYELADTRVGTSLASLLDIAMTIGPCEVDDTGRCR